MADNEDISQRDLRSGVPLEALPDGGFVRGRVDSEDAILVRRGDALHAVGAFCTHYHGPLADGLIVGDTVRCPVASRVLFPAHRRSVACAGVGSDRLLACRAGRRHGVRPRADGGTGTANGRAARSHGRPAHRGSHRRRGSRRTRGGGHAPPPGLRRRADDDQCGRLSPVRPAEPLQGLPCRHGARRLDTAARARVLHRPPHRSRPQRAGRRARRPATTRGPRKRDAAQLRNAAAGDRGRPGSAHDSGIDRFPHPLSAHASPTAARSWPRPRRRGVWSWSGPVSSGSRSRHRCARAESTSTWSRPRARRSSGCWARKWAASSASCTSRTG